MTLKLREAMIRVAAASPALEMPADLFDRARKRRRVRTAGGALTAIVVLAGMVSLGWVVVQGPPTPRPAAVAQDRHVPGTVARAPGWVADLRDAPLDRAQFAYVEPDAEGRDSRLIVVSGDRYRTADLGGTLSPDGRYLAYEERQSTKLLDVSTGETAMLAEGQPMAWSRGGDSLVLRRSLGADETEMSVVSVPSGAIIWSFEVVPPCVGHRVALSPDKESVAVGCRQFGTYLYRREAGLVWQTQGREVAGPQAWAPNGRTIATWAFYDTTHRGELFMLDVADGRSIAEVPVPSLAASVLIAWHEDRPVLQGPDWVMRLSAEPVYVTRMSSANRISLATAAIDFGGSREQGRIDAGPLLSRYRDLLPYVYFSLFLVIALAWALVARRVRQRFGRYVRKPSPSVS
jgi:hypothetical protein